MIYRIGIFCKELLITMITKRKLLQKSKNRNKKIPQYPEGFFY